ncbi:MAG: PQQ-dependent sugar dehydrogenase [Solirubrobacterales bacterium]
MARRTKQMLLLAAALLAGLAIAAPAAGAKLQLKSIGRFQQPVYVTQAPGTAGILVVEQTGRVMSVKGKRRSVFLDIRSIVRAEGERGLLSIAFPDNFQSSGLFYAYYTTSSGDNAVAEFHASAGRADPNSRREVLLIPHPGQANHNGGQLQFGPDGLLYIASGDGGGAGDPDNSAQTTDNLLGKILRIDPRANGAAPYSSPAGNPFAGGATGRDEIFSIGLRNPFRFSFAGNRIVIADVGQDRFEEVDYEDLATANGANFGWNDFEAFQPFDGAIPPAPSRHDRPIFAYSIAGKRCALIGGYVVRDPKLGGLQGRYVFGDFCDGVIRSLVPGLDRASKVKKVKVKKVPELSSFGESLNGNLYATSLSGAVFRFKRGR